jgi:hypothetical protein
MSLKPKKIKDNDENWHYYSDDDRILVAENKLKDYDVEKNPESDCVLQKIETTIPSKIELENGNLTCCIGKFGYQSAIATHGKKIF